MEIKVKSGTQVNREALSRMIKQKDEPYVQVRSTETGQVRRAKLSYARQLLKENKVKILSKI